MRDKNKHDMGTSQPGTDSPEKEHNIIVRLLAWRCEKCPICSYARSNPESLAAKVVRFHGKFCPMWRAHEKVYGE